MVPRCTDTQSARLRLSLVEFDDTDSLHSCVEATLNLRVILFIELTESLDCLAALRAFPFLAIGGFIQSSQ